MLNLMDVCDGVRTEPIEEVASSQMKQCVQMYRLY